jgi:hypothetical protein
MYDSFIHNTSPVYPGAQGTTRSDSSAASLFKQASAFALALTPLRVDSSASLGMTEKGRANYHFVTASYETEH